MQMHSSAKVVLQVLVSALALVATACTGSPVGDPCVPESIPPGPGFDSQEVYLETSSVQCRTRVCMVYQLEGNPELICEDCENCAGCLPRATVNAQVLCTCRCSANGDTNIPLCDCGDGFRCLDEGERGFVTAGGEGVQGGYCVPCIRPDGEDRQLDPTLFEQCPQD